VDTVVGVILGIKSCDLISQSHVSIETNDTLINGIGFHYLIKSLTLLTCYFTFETSFPSWLAQFSLCEKEGQC
jgi:hypothetical protein